MKKKLTITVDAELLPRAKRYARSQGVSLSSLIEESLAGTHGGPGAGLRRKVEGPVRSCPSGR